MEGGEVVVLPLLEEVGEVALLPLEEMGEVEVMRFQDENSVNQ